MKWIKSTDRLPAEEGDYLCESIDGFREMLSYWPERGWFTDLECKGELNTDEVCVRWLDESAPSITADDVKDLQFKKSAGTPILYAEYHFVVTAFGEFAVGKRRGGTWEIIYPMQITPTPCADLEGGTELLNQHHKEYILSQLK